MKKILVANRGEIAVRVIRACKELDIASVAIHSTADRDSLHTKIADESICIGPAESAKSYLSIPKVMSAAELAGVDAIHPGYGFLSESSEFAAVCEKYGITFIGPRPKQMEILGNKVNAREMAQSLGVPLLPGSSGVVTDIDSAINIATDIGFPLIIKAANGGGGRGMKIVRDHSELKRLFPLAQSEALVGFGSSDCYLERYLERPRHIEVQIIGDKHGNICSLGERDCSIQRRHQKIIEEAPSCILDADLRDKVNDYALKLVSACNYESLGTVEFLYQDGAFYFMEVNVRAQVEHPVTEEVNSVDLIKEQIKIAFGDKLSWSKDFPQIKGHSIECRINAEDPRTFVPSPGLVAQFHVPGGPGVRIDSMLYAGYKVPPNYDSLIAKVITFGENRNESLARMRRALQELKVEGIRTNINFHLEILNNQEFISGDISTSFIANFLAKKNKKSYN